MILAQNAINNGLKARQSKDEEKILIKKDHTKWIETVRYAYKNIDDLAIAYGIAIDKYTILEQENKKLKTQLEPFQDPYFKDLPMESIAELAKKSIRLTTANSELEDKLELCKEKDLAEKFIQERLKHEESEALMFEKLEKARITITEYLSLFGDMDNSLEQLLQEID